MRLLVATDAHLFITPDGKYWCKSIYGYNFWVRYLHVFDEIRIVARAENILSSDEKMLLVEGKGVTVYPVPSYRGPIELMKKYYFIHRALYGAYEGVDVALFRMPSQTAFMTYQHCPKGLPVGGEIVYDPYDDILQSSTFMRILNKRISSQLSSFCKAANGVSYVTENSIQNHYPSYARINGEDKDHFETFYSTITLSDNAFTGPRDFSNKKSLKIVLSSVSMNSERKGEKVLISAIKKARASGYDVSSVIIGDGSLRASFEEFAKSLGIHDYVQFTGLLPSSDDVRSIMLDADMFVFPTQGEGLPRGILEAMAIGLPVLSTPVGGIPEVIDRKYLFNPLDSDAFAKEICRLLDNPDELTLMSKTNYNKSLEFKNVTLQKKRDEFYTKLIRLVRR